jgi:hypothetical protein
MRSDRGGERQQQLYNDRGGAYRANSPWDAPQSPAAAAFDQVTSPAAPPAQQALLSTCGSPHGEAQADSGGAGMEASPVSRPSTRLRAAQAATAVSPTVDRLPISAAVDAAGAFGSHPRSMRIHTTTEAVSHTTDEQRSAGRVSASGAGAGAEAGRGRKNSAKSSAQAVQVSAFDACIAVRRSERTRGNGGGSGGGGALPVPSEAGEQLGPPGRRPDRDSVRDALRRVRTLLATMEICGSKDEMDRARAVVEAVDARGGSVLMGRARAALEALDIRSGSADALHVVRT